MVTPVVQRIAPLLAATVAADNCNIMQSLLANQRQHFTRLLERANDISVFNRDGCGPDLMVVAASLPSSSSSSIANAKTAVTRSVPPIAAAPAMTTHAAMSATTTTMASTFTFKCPLCSLVYRTQAFLNEHMRNEHSILI